MKIKPITNQILSTFKQNQFYNSTKSKIYPAILGIIDLKLLYSNIMNVKVKFHNFYKKC